MYYNILKIYLNEGACNLIRAGPEFHLELKKWNEFHLKDPNKVKTGLQGKPFGLILSLISSLSLYIYI